MPVSTLSDKNIWVAAGDGDLPRVMVILSPNVPDLFTYTPMHAAASYGHLNILEYLISRGGNVNVVDEDGETPLYTVENVETAQFLLNHGADPTWRNHQGLMPADLLQDEFPQVAAYLNSVTTSRATESRGRQHDDLTSDWVVQPSQHSQEAASEYLTSSLMSQLGDIARREDEVGDETHIEEELRQAVSRTVLEAWSLGIR
ncbi:ankyrin repeat-containing domain protein [Multifurca ochricompacta]|uniref:Ankyrin repeat-containing domain protein n=1 Tax=Multifurca ochricompacta TaxID=376703 RepID=A0AAD4M8X2_9AGAM|nr:ankyrin repeat-containing domain protein [Multifurca ochricompacta]